ncbi:MAG: glutamine-hydrolyzing carbamoyl-phosphate synthase small subunit [Candidatus Micrarchaeia archaeon]
MIYLAFLYLEDGSIIAGKGFGARGVALGELVFSTSMNGYPESMTDPSYRGQILVFTHPLVGNYGVPKLRKNENVIINFESESIQVRGIVVNELNSGYKYDKSKTLSKWMKEQNIAGIEVVDTRDIVSRIREKGVLKAAICNGVSVKEAAKKLQEFRYSGSDFISEVSTDRIKKYGKGDYNIMVFDFGIKHGIIRELLARNTRLVVVPYNFPAKDVLKIMPDGIVYTNGPGDPNKLHQSVIDMREVLASGIPVLGICLGHQLIAKSFGGRIEKMKYGHRAINKGVYDTLSKKAIITTHNHGYAVKKIPMNSKLWFYSLDDKTVEGLIYEKHNIITTQFHPEGGPGTNDGNYVFDRFMEMVKIWKAKKAMLKK